jgi:hypothetical protein
VLAIGRGSGARRGSSPTATPTTWRQGRTSPEVLLLRRRTKECRGLRLHSVEAPLAAVGGCRRQHLRGGRSAIDGGRWRWAWVSGSTTPRPPPTAAYPLAPRAGSGRCFPCFLLMGLRAEFLLGDYNWIRYPSRRFDFSDEPCVFQPM